MPTDFGLLVLSEEEFVPYKEGPTPGPDTEYYLSPGAGGVDPVKFRGTQYLMYKLYKNQTGVRKINFRLPNLN